MKAILTIIFSALLFSQSSDPNKVAGDWEGTLEFQGQQFRLVLHLKNVEGKLSGTLDSPDQGAAAMGIKIDTIEFKENKLTFAINQIGGSYEGTLKDKKIEGKWSQGGVTLDLNLTRVKKKGTS